MTVGNLAILGLQAALGLVGLGVGGAKVTHREDQVEDFQRFGYPQWFRIVTGLVEIGAGIGLLVGLRWRPGLALGRRPPPRRRHAWSGGDPRSHR